MRILAVAYSARYVADSALKAGFEVRAADFFGDRDLRERVESTSVLRDLGKSFSAKNLLAAAEMLGGDALVYSGGLENSPELVTRLAKGRELLGNPPEVLAAVRDWRLLACVLREADLPAPQVLFPGEEGRAPRSKLWLAKPRRGSAGAGIRFWNGGPLGRGEYLQEFLQGVSGSFTFLADGERALPIAITEQLVGLRELCARPFGWCGNVAPLGALRDPSERKKAEELLRRTAETLTKAFSLRGLNGIDFILAGPKGGRIPVPVEVNPRPAASLEVIEAFLGRPLFGDHVRACRGTLPAESFPRGSGFHGKGIVFARGDLVVSSTDGWIERGRADVPFEGDEVSAGSPICTVRASGKTRKECLKTLFASAGDVRREIGDRLSRRDRRRCD